MDLEKISSKQWQFIIFSLAVWVFSSGVESSSTSLLLLVIGIFLYLFYSESIKTLESRLTRVEKTLQSIEETINYLKNASANIPFGGHKMCFDDFVKGVNVELSNSLRTAERKTPLDNDTFGGVISNFPLIDDKIFMFRIDETIDKWTKIGISLGAINRKELKNLQEKNYIVYINGTWGVFSDGAYGKSHAFKDGNNIGWNAYPLETSHLPVGTTLGMMRTSKGCLHFFINGIDVGAAFTDVPKGVYAFVDVTDYVTKISIV